MTRAILIAEDEESIRDLLSEIFNVPGRYSVICAKDGEEALRIAQDQRPDVILLDVLLPKLDGQQVCRLVKSNPELANTKVLMMSGMVQQSDIRRAQELGADAYIAKPFSSDALVAKVEELFHQV